MGDSPRSIPRNSTATSCRYPSRSSMNFVPRCLRSSSTLPLMPRPSFISICSARDTTSREASSMNSGAYFSMNLSPSALIRYAPSPRAASESRIPLPASVVGWYWTISMSMSDAPALHASARPSPVQIRALVDGSNTRPAPPAAMITAFARIVSISPVCMFNATAPRQTPSSTISEVTNHSSYIRMSSRVICSYSTCSIAEPVIAPT